MNDFDSFKYGIHIFQLTYQAVFFFAKKAAV